jgi:hypothetical protein
MLIEILQNRRLPIVAFSLHVYWRINRSPNDPVRMVTSSLVLSSNLVTSCGSNHLPSPYTD